MMTKLREMTFIFIWILVIAFVGLMVFEWGMDFGAPHETALTERYEKPVFVYGYPTQVKAFYM